MSLRVVVAQSGNLRTRAMAQRLAALGYEVVAQVSTIREAVDAVTTVEPDAVLFDVHLSDGAGVHGAVSVTRARVGTAAVILSPHPALADRAARPNWGAVALISDASSDADLDADVQEIVMTARSISEPVFIETATEIEDKDIPLVDIAIDSSEPESFQPESFEPEVESREVVVERAVAQIVARTRLTPADALKLMEEEADEDGRDILEVATAILAEADAAA